MRSEDGLAEAREELSELGLDELEHRARGGQSLPLCDWLALGEAWGIVRALRETLGNRSAAAQALGIGRRTLYSKMERLGLGTPWGGRLPGPGPEPSAGSN
jgi:transcriptional regulator of acetoin/glycerol metabolism